MRARLLAVGCCAIGLALGGGVGAVSAPAAVTGTGSTPADLTAGSTEVHHYEYVFQPGQMYIYDIDHEQKLVRHVSGLPDTDGVRGVMVDPASHRMYISHNGDGPEGTFDGSMFAYNLVAEEMMWEKEYPFPVDSGAITPDGTTIYMPTGENSSSGLWHILKASNGEPMGTVKGGANAHNTIVSLDGKYVFLGGRNSEYLDVASTATNEVVKEIGPLEYGIRPFTVNGTDTLAFTTATKFLGFQVSSIATGKVLYTVPIPGFTLPPEYSGPPSHGISLTPNEKQLYVMDAPHDYVHVFDVSGLPSTAPTLVASIKLSPRTGEEEPCPYDCGKSGWLQASRDGRYVFVGDTGDVIDTQTLKIVNTLAPLSETRQLLEVDWSDGLPVATTSRYGLGYVTSEGKKAEEEHKKEQEERERKKAEEERKKLEEGKTGEGGGKGTTGEGSSGSLTSPAPGPALGPPAAVTSGAAAAGVPEITGLEISPSVFKAINAGGTISRGRGSTAATVRYQDSGAALSTFVVLEGVTGVESSGHRCVSVSRSGHGRGRRCRRYIPVGHFTHGDVAGEDRFGFTGWLGGHRLAVGSYRLQVTPRSGADSGAPRSVAFRVIA
jgi:DNA-binding beta-propeller fold protein YncE